MEAAENLFHQYIAKFGMPRKIVSDRNQAFLGVMFSSLAKFEIHSSVARTSSYRACANSSAEIVNKFVINYFRAYLKPQEDWTASLSTICMANRYLASQKLISIHFKPCMAFQ